MSFLRSARRTAPSFAALAACFALGGHPVQAQEITTLPAKGPLPIRDPEPLITPFLQPTPAGASVLDRGRTRWDTDIDLANNFVTVGAANRRYLTDFEDQRLSLGWARGLSHGQEIGIRTMLIARNGGILDHTIVTYHSTFGFQGGGRGNVPKNRMLFVVTDSQGRQIVNTTESATGLSDTVLEYRRRLTPESTEASPHTADIIARALLKLPTGNYHELFGSGAVDTAGGLSATWRPTRHFALHGDLSLVLYGDTRIPNLDARSTNVESMIAAEYLCNGRTSLVFQTDDAPAPFASGIAYPDRPRRAFSFGLWRQVNNQNRFFISGVENDFGPFAKHAPDFTLSFGLRRIL